MSRVDSKTGYLDTSLKEEEETRPCGASVSSPLPGPDSLTARTHWMCVSDSQPPNCVPGAQLQAHLQAEVLSCHAVHKEGERLAPHGVLAVGTGLGTEGGETTDTGTCCFQSGPRDQISHAADGAAPGLHSQIEKASREVWGLKTPTS